MDDERREAEVPVVEGQREEGGAAAQRELDAQRLRRHHRELLERLRLDVGLRVERRRRPRVHQTELEEHRLHLPARAGGRRRGGIGVGGVGAGVGAGVGGVGGRRVEAELDPQPPERAQDDLLVAVADAEGGRAEVTAAVEDVRREHLVAVRRASRGDAGVRRRLRGRKRHGGAAAARAVGARTDLVDALREEVDVAEAGELEGELRERGDRGAIDHRGVNFASPRTSRELAGRPTDRDRTAPPKVFI